MQVVPHAAVDFYAPVVYTYEHAQINNRMEESNMKKLLALLLAVILVLSLAACASAAKLI